LRWRWTGTHTAPFRGIAPSGKSIDVLGEDVIRIQDGRITDVWPLFDPLRLMLQIGAISENY
jgi:predicted ester cyclase